MKNVLLLGLGLAVLFLVACAPQIVEKEVVVEKIVVQEPELKVLLYEELEQIALSKTKQVFDEKEKEKMRLLIFQYTSGEEKEEKLLALEKWGISLNELTVWEKHFDENERVWYLNVGKLIAPGVSNVIKLSSVVITKDGRIVFFEWTGTK